MIDEIKEGMREEVKERNIGDMAGDTIRYIKDPKPPMPKLYPDLIDERSVVAVTTYIREELARQK